MKTRRVSLLLLILCFDIIIHSSSSPSSSSSRERVQSFAYCRFLPDLILSSYDFSLERSSICFGISFIVFPPTCKRSQLTEFSVPRLEILVLICMACLSIYKWHCHAYKTFHGLSSAMKKKEKVQFFVVIVVPRLDNSIRFYLFEINNERWTSSSIDEEEKIEKGNANNSRRERKRTTDEYERSSGKQIIRLASSKFFSKKKTRRRRKNISSAIYSSQNEKKKKKNKIMLSVQGHSIVIIIIKKKKKKQVILRHPRGNKEDNMLDRTHPK